MKLRILLLMITLSALPRLALGQNDKVTPENAQQKMKEQHDQEEKKYLQEVKQHQDRQGKAGKKRMKKHLKESRKLRNNHEMPWYKRLFRRRK